MLFVLTQVDFDVTEIKGIFSDIEKAKTFAETTLGYDTLNWSHPNAVGSVWANTNSGPFFIKPAELDPTTA